MSAHLAREIEALKQRMLHLCAIVEENLHKAVKAIELRDAAMAEEVVRKDVEIDDIEVETEEECLKILALYQPVAKDLSFIVAILKINNDLERIGDLSVNIAKQVCHLAMATKVAFPSELWDMTDKTRAMLKGSLDSLINLDPELARQVCVADKEVDALNKQVIEQAKEKMEGATPEHLDALIRMISVARHLERIGDHATNIAEDIFYMINGEIVRHKLSKKSLPPAG